MKTKELRDLFKAMREFGISKVKMEGLEVTLRRGSLAVKADHSVSAGRSLAGSTPAPATSTESEPIKHKMEMLGSLLKLSDTELLDELFPDKSEDEEIA